MRYTTDCLFNSSVLAFWCFPSFKFISKLRLGRYRKKALIWIFDTASFISFASDTFNICCYSRLFDIIQVGKNCCKLVEKVDFNSSF